MISQRDLLERPEEYQPLGSAKSVRNKEHKMPPIDIVLLFSSRSNKDLLKNNLFRISEINGSNDSPQYISDLVEKSIPAYLCENDISTYKLAEYQAVEFNDYVLLLRYINTEFIKFCYRGLKWNQFNPFRQRMEVGATGERRSVKGSDLLASDIPTINIHSMHDSALLINSKKFRNGNAVPYFQAHMHQRHYDRSNEGLSVESANESSLETPVYGYDMEPIHKVLNSWTKKGWFGL